MQEPVSKKKIAILGGGISALTAAFELTNPANPRHAEYEVTIYQLGWRLGGKAASGRNMSPEYSYRVEEDGIHIFYGFYDNAFQLMQKCYDELNRAPDAPLSSWQKAFLPGSYTEVYQLFKERGEPRKTWHRISYCNPPNNQIPGTKLETPLSTLLETYAEAALGLLLGIFKSSAFSRLSDEIERYLDDDLKALIASLYKADWRRKAETGAPDCRVVRAPNYKTVMLMAADQLAYQISRSPLALTSWLYDQEELIERVFRRERLPYQDLPSRIAGEPAQVGLEVMSLILYEFRKLLWKFVGSRVRYDFDVYKHWVQVNWLIGIIVGITKERLLEKGLCHVNDKEYRKWLEPYLFDDGKLTLDSVITNSIYGATFNYKDGDLKKMNMEAGTTLMALIRIALTYRGAYCFYMQAGTGDVVFAPLYLALKARGVKFEFFTRIEELKLSHDWSRVDEIRIERQVVLKNKAKGYEPLVDVKGLPCWPDRPLYDQIKDGETYKNVDFESYSSPGIPAPPLKHGVDFDQVILGISIGAVRCVFPEVFDLKRSKNRALTRKWSRMAEKVGTVRTQSFQVWFKKTFNQLGAMAPPATGTGFDACPMNSYADMSHYIPWEGWPALDAAYPLGLAMFCGAMKDIPGSPDPCRPLQGRDEVKEYALAVLKEHAGFFWPKAVSRPEPGLHWNLLVDNRKPPVQGEKRFDSQFWTATPNPSNRYTRIPTGSSKHRLGAGGSGFANLFLTGDWIDNTFYMGCIEGGVMSGLATANAMSGFPRLSEISGWGFGGPKGP